MAAAHVPQTPKRILIVGPGDLAAELGRTILWRREIERVHAPDLDTGFEAARTVQPSLLIVDAGSLEQAFAFIWKVRKDPVVRSTGIGVFFARSPTVLEEEALRLA